VTALADRLRAADVFADLPEERLAWLAGLGEVAEVRAGTVVARQGDPADAFWLILDGRVRWTRRVGGREVHAVTLGAGEVFAELILILGAPYPTTGTAIEATTLVRFAPDAFWAILGTCHGVLARVTRIAVERAEIHETVAQQQARLVGLGQVASGLAHELGNPTAALVRAAASLEGAVEALAGPPPSPAGDGALDPLERADREEDLRERLSAAGRGDAGELAAILVGTDIDPGDTDDLARVAAQAQLHALAAEIRTAAGRIGALVEATKAVTAMDRDRDLEPVDLPAVLRSAISILEPGRIDLAVAGAVPPVLGSAGDLGQVLVELLRNGLQSGRRVTVEVSAEEAAWVQVAVDDDGPGVAAAAADRLFEPFFSTRGAAGAGLGLHRARRIAEQHDGHLGHAGGARFVLRLPAAGPAAAGGGAGGDPVG
jgi:signal transduction histidine kinase